MLEQSSVITIMSAFGSAGIILYGVSLINKTNLENLKASFTEFKGEIKEEIVKEKKHAMELAGQRIGGIEKDLDEIWPRFRKAEENINKNCYVLSTIQSNCIKHRKEVGG